MEIKIPDHLNAEQTLFALLQAYRNAPYIGALWTANSLNTQLDPSIPTLSSSFPEAYHTIDWILGIGNSPQDEDLKPQTMGKDFDFEAFEAMHLYKPAFRMGYFAYDMKAHSMGHTSTLPPATGAPEHAFWFRPSLLLTCKGNQITVKIDQYFQHIKIKQILSQYFKEEKQRDQNTKASKSSNHLLPKTLGDIMQCGTDFNEYRHRIQEIRHKIQQGTFYELNYCIEWTGKHKIENPVSLWKSMTEKSGAPFSALIKNKEFYTLCNSPERFLKISGDQIISQPIKGTAPRCSDSLQDRQFLETLRNNPKDQAEHVMIVDLVRNDLTRCSDPLSVEVSELCQVYSFKTVHQLISTIRCRMTKENSLASILNACFPMGSMTGAPKAVVCHWIDQLEKKRRGVYSGSIGYIDAEGNLDLNVVIRTLIYDDVKRELSLSTGGAITWDSDPKTEWEECQTKAKAILQVEVPA